MDAYIPHLCRQEGLGEGMPTVAIFAIVRRDGCVLSWIVNQRAHKFLIVPTRSSAEKLTGISATRLRIVELGGLAAEELDRGASGLLSAARCIHRMRGTEGGSGQAV